jgi:hypothetical protein
MRKKATYTLPGARFDAYPPRHDTLARIYLEQEGLYYPPYDDMQQQNEDEENAALAAQAAEISSQQRNGMSSVVIYDADGHRVNSGPDIYGARRNGKKMAKRKESDQDTSEPSSGMSTPLITETQNLRTPRVTVVKEELPEAMTTERIDFLVQDYRRHRQLRAVERRQNLALSGNLAADAAQIDLPSLLQEELRKAFSTIDGFLAAFTDQEEV